MKILLVIGVVVVALYALTRAARAAAASSAPQMRPTPVQEGLVDMPIASSGSTVQGIGYATGNNDPEIKQHQSRIPIYGLLTPDNGTAHFSVN